jgi:hypothetical protein
LTTRRGWPPEIVEKVTELFFDGLTPPEILRKLEVAQARGNFDVEKLPELRTIQRWVEPFRTVDRSKAWRLGPAADAGAAFILGFRAELMTFTKGRIAELNQETVSWLLSIQAVAPDLEVIVAFRIAGMYQARDQEGQETGDLDAWLGFRPWRGPDALARYEAAVAEGWIKPPPADALNMLARLAQATPTA